MAEQLQAVENSHKAQGYPESPYTHEHICYNFFIGSDGTTKQLRGINEYPGCTRNAEKNDEAVQIVLAGDFNQENPSDAQLRSLAKLIEQLRVKYDIPSEHVIGHKEASATSCPGDRVMKLLQFYRINS